LRVRACARARTHTQTQNDKPVIIFIS